MSDHDHTDYLDPRRWLYLDDVGSPEYIAAVMVGPDGEQRLILAHRDHIGDDSVRYDPTCPDAPHEQSGPLPLDFVARITVSSRTHRCGRPTKAGAPCRTPVTRPGDTCAWHRTTSDASETSR